MLSIKDRKCHSLEKVERFQETSISYLSSLNTIVSFFFEHRDSVVDTPTRLVDNHTVQGVLPTFLYEVQVSNLLLTPNIES